MKPLLNIMAYSEELAEAVRTASAATDGITERKMFGGVCLFLNGNMLCGIETAHYMFRVGKAREPEALTRPGATPMVLNGRPMGGLIRVEAAACDAVALRDWLDLARAFVGALPPK